MGHGTNGRHRRLIWLTFAFCLMVYLLTHAGRIMHGDDETMYRVTRNLAEGRGIRVSKETVTIEGIVPTGSPAMGFLPTRPYAFETTFASPGRAGGTYSKYGIGQSLIALPFYWAGKTMDGCSAGGGSQVWAKLWVSFVNPIISAWSCAVLFALALTLGYSPRLSLCLALTYGFGTMAWAYAKSFFSEPAVTLVMLLAILCLCRLSHANAGRQLALTGLCVGTAMLFRSTSIIAIPAVLVAMIWILRQNDVDVRKPGLWASFWAGPLAAGIALLAYNWARFGSLFSTGYTEVAWDSPFLAGLYGFLFSPGKSVFLYNPIVIASPIGLWLSMCKRDPLKRALAIFTILLGLSYLIFHAPYNYWTGGWNWGPRFLLPALPFLVLASAPLAEHRKLRGGKTLIMMLALAGFLLTLPAILVDHSRYLIGLSERYPSDYYTRCIFQPELSPALHQWPVAWDVWKRFMRPATREQMRSILAGEPTIEPADAPLLDRQSARLLWQAEWLRNNAPDFWYIGLVLTGHLASEVAVAIAAGPLFSSVIVGVLLLRAVQEMNP